MARNTFVYGHALVQRRGSWTTPDIALKPCRVEVELGCAFINFDDNAPSFRECIGPLADRLELQRRAICAPNGGLPPCCRPTGRPRWKPSWKAIT